MSSLTPDHIQKDEERGHNIIGDSQDNKCYRDSETGKITFYVSLVFVVLSVSGRHCTVLKLLHAEAVFKHVS